MNRIKTALFAGAMVPVFAAPSFAAGLPRVDVAHDRPIVLAQKECDPEVDPNCRQRGERRGQRPAAGQDQGAGGEEQRPRKRRPAVEDAPADEGQQQERPRRNREQPAAREAQPEGQQQERPRRNREQPSADEAQPEGQQQERPRRNREQPAADEAQPEGQQQERPRRNREQPSADEAQPEGQQQERPRRNREQPSADEAQPEGQQQERPRRNREQPSADEAQPEGQQQERRRPVDVREAPTEGEGRVTDEPQADRPAGEPSSAEDRLRQRRDRNRPGAEEPAADEQPARRPAAEEPAREQRPAERPAAEEPSADQPARQGERRQPVDVREEPGAAEGRVQEAPSEDAIPIQEEDPAVANQRIQRLREQRRQRSERPAAREERPSDDAETLQDVRRERRERRENGNTYIEEPDGRVIIENRGIGVIIRNDESDRIRDFSRDVQVRQLGGGREETTVYRRNGTQVITIRDERGFVIRRSRVTADGREYVLFSNEPNLWERPEDLIVRLPPPPIRIPRDRYVVEAERAAPEVIYETFAAAPIAPVDRRYSLDQVVNSPDLLDRVRRVDIDSIHFATGSWKVDDSQIDALDAIADSILRIVKENPSEVFLIEGHTDAVGSDIDNLTLSDRRAEEVAYLLTEYYDVPPENLTTKGYGESYLKVDTEGPSEENRRVTMRRITPLLETSQR